MNRRFDNLNINRLYPENYFKIIIIIGLFLTSFVIFKILQRPQIYEATLKKITHTYVRDSVDTNIVWKVYQPYYYRDSLNTLRWDGLIYWQIQKDFYKNGEWKYAFFPLFPVIWRILNISSLYIGLINYLLFGLSVLIFSNLFYKEKIESFSERMCVFITALILPTITIYYLPYAEALFTFTFALAMWGLIKNKYRVFFISIFFFSLTRPIFVHVGLAFLIMDSLLFLKHRNFSHFIKELSLKLLPLLSGTLCVFSVFYLTSGSFFKYFEVINKYWKTSFQIPHQISDWSIEGFGINVFVIFFIVFPSLILFIKYFKTFYQTKEKPELSGISKGDASYIREYFFYVSIIYFAGVLLFTLIYQNGSLNGLSRYILASPFAYIFFFYVYHYLKKVSISKFVIAGGLLLIASILMLTGVAKLEPQINFSDFGFFILLIDLIFLFSLKYLNNFMKVSLMTLISFVSIVLITYMYNIYLCNAWIYT